MMKRIHLIVGCVPIAALITSLAFSATASPAASSRHTTITCPLLKAGRLTLDVPGKLGDLPEIDFDYPAKATLFASICAIKSLRTSGGGTPNSYSRPRSSKHICFNFAASAT